MKSCSDYIKKILEYDKIKSNTLIEKLATLINDNEETNISIEEITLAVFTEDEEYMKENFPAPEAQNLINDIYSSDIILKQKLLYLEHFYSDHRTILLKQIKQIVSDLIKSIKHSNYQIEPQHVERIVSHDILQNIPNIYFLEDYDHGAVTSRSTINYIRNQFTRENIQFTQERINTLLENFDNTITNEIRNIVTGLFSTEENLAPLGLEYIRSISYDNEEVTMPTFLVPPVSPVPIGSSSSSDNSFFSQQSSNAGNENLLAPNDNIIGEIPNAFIKSMMIPDKFI